MLRNACIPRGWVSLQQHRSVKQWIRRKETDPFHKQLLVAICSHPINRLELHLHPNISTDDGWKGKASKELETGPFQQQFLLLICSHHINGLEMCVQPNISTEDGWEWRASKE